MVADLDGIRRFPTPGKQPVAHEDGLGDIDQLAVRVASLGPEHLERLSLVRTPPLRPTWLDQPGARRRIEAAAKGLSPLDLLDLVEEDAA